MISIFSYPSHQEQERTAGVDLVRIIQPMTYLGKEEGFKVHLWNFNDYPADMNWERVAQEHDILYFNYLSNPWGFAMMGMLARKYKRKMIMDVDDDLWNILKDNSVYDAYKVGSEAIKVFTSISNEVDYITTTNNYLKNLIINNTSKTYDKVKVFPNYIDLNLYKYKPEPRDEYTVWVTHFGSTSHFGDLLDTDFVEGVHKIMREYPNFRFRTIGSFLPQFADRWGRRYENKFGSVDIYKWVSTKFPIFMEDTDIILAPLRMNTYNLCKSGIKFLEASSAKKVGCYQNIRQYQELVKNGVNGFLCDNKESWYRSIKYLIEYPLERKIMGEEAYKTTQKYQIKDHISNYAEFFQQILKT